MRRLDSWIHCKDIGEAIIRIGEILLDSIFIAGGFLVHGKPPISSAIEPAGIDGKSDLEHAMR
jgi:hypothetical protein